MSWCLPGNRRPFQKPVSVFTSLRKKLLRDEMGAFHKAQHKTDGWFLFHFYFYLCPYMAVAIYHATNHLSEFTAVTVKDISPFSDFSSVPDTKLDWLLADEGGANRLLSSSLPWVTSPLSELFRESLRAERDDDVLLLSLRGLLEFRPVQVKHRKRNVIRRTHFSHQFFVLYLASAVAGCFSICPRLVISYLD